MRTNRNCQHCPIIVGLAMDLMYTGYTNRTFTALQPQVTAALEIPQYGFFSVTGVCIVHSASRFTSPRTCEWYWSPTQPAAAARRANHPRSDYPINPPFRYFTGRYPHSSWPHYHLDLEGFKFATAEFVKGFGISYYFSRILGNGPSPTVNICRVSVYIFIYCVIKSVKHRAHRLSI